MSQLVALIERAKRDHDFGSLADAMPYIKWMGITYDDTTGALLGRMAYSPHLVGNASLPALHGGTLGALLESTAIFQLLWEAETVVLPKTINITVDYLRSARARDTFAHAVIVKKGRRVTSVHVQAWQEDRDKPTAAATAHFLIKEVGS